MIYGERFPNWGDTGERPPNGFQFSGGDPYDEAHVDYLWTNLNKFENEVADTFESGLDATTYKGNDIDDDGDGIVDAADFAYSGNATSYKNNDIDVDGDGIVNKAHNVENYKQTCGIPKTTLKPGDKAIRERYVPSGYTIEFYRIGVEPNGAVVPSGLKVRAIDQTNFVQFFNSSSRFEDLNANATAQPGPIKVEMGVYNDSTDTTIDASGELVYKIYEQA